MADDIGEKLDSLDFFRRHRPLKERWILSETPFSASINFFYIGEGVTWIEKSPSGIVNFVNFDDVLLRVPEDIQIKLLFNIDLFK